MNEDNQYGSNENKKITEENSEETLISEPGENMLIEFQRDGQSQEDTLSCPFSYSGPMQQVSDIQIFLTNYLGITNTQVNVPTF